MEEEKRYKECLYHVVKFLDADGIDCFKPLSAKLANDIAEMCRLVLSGKTTEEAIKEVWKKI